MAEHGGAVLPVMAERHHPCCHTHPGAPLGGGKAPRVTGLGPVGTWVGEGAARAREWAIIIFQRDQLVGIQPPSQHQRGVCVRNKTRVINMFCSMPGWAPPVAV